MGSKKIIQVIIAGLLIMGIFWGLASATIIYDNNVVVATGATSDPGIGLFVADDFVLQPGATTITDIHWTGLYAEANTPGTDNFTIRFYADNSGNPAASPFQTYIFGSSVNRTDTGIDILGFDLYSYSVDISPLSLSANTRFWLSIVNNTNSDPDDNWSWGAAEGGNSRFVLSDGIWRENTRGLDFQLTGIREPVLTGIPEPASMLLLLLGFAVLALRRKGACPANRADSSLAQVQLF